MCQPLPLYVFHFISLTPYTFPPPHSLPFFYFSFTLSQVIARAGAAQRGRTRRLGRHAYATPGVTDAASLTVNKTLGEENITGKTKKTDARASAD